MYSYFFRFFISCPIIFRRFQTHRLIFVVRSGTKEGQKIERDGRRDCNQHSIQGLVDRLQ